MHFKISGGRPLRGHVNVNGSKNSALALISAAALAEEGVTVLENVPKYTDIVDLCDILEALGIEVSFEGENTLRIDARHMGNHVAPYDKARRIRVSTYVIGALLPRLGKAEVAVPGGCDIGARPVDFHLKGLAALGAEAWVEHGSILAHSPDGLMGTNFYVERASVGTTVFMMIGASLAKGTTLLENAAREPEIVDLANFLTSMGATIRGAGTDTIRIQGTERLRGCRHEIIPDRLVAGTYLLAGLATGGEVRVDAVIPEHLMTVRTKLEEAGAHLEILSDAIIIKSPKRPQATDIQTQPHPGFPTDIHPPFVAAMTRAEGISVVQETIFESRFAYANELLRMGANIKVERDTAIIRGVEELSGAPVEARDLRGGAALIVAGLAAQGETLLGGIRHVDRGYEDLDKNLSSLGAEITRQED